MGLMDIISGKRCEMCGKRKDTVGKRPGTALQVCTPCGKSLRKSDKGTPPGTRASGYRAGSGQPPHLAGPMGSPYRGPAVKPQRRK